MFEHMIINDTVQRNHERVNQLNIIAFSFKPENCENSLDKHFLTYDHEAFLWMDPLT